MGQCPNCGAEVGERDAACQACGYDLTAGGATQQGGDQGGYGGQPSQGGQHGQGGQPPQGRGGGTNQPRQGRGQPGGGANQPRQGQGQPPRGQGQGQQPRGQPPQGQGQPRQGRGQPGQAQGHGQPGQAQGQGQPQQGQGQPQQGHGQPPQGQRGQPRGDVGQYGNQPPQPVDDGGIGRRELLIGGGGLAVLGAGGLYFFTDILGGGGADMSYGDTVEGEITSDSETAPVDNKLAATHTFNGDQGDVVRVSMQPVAPDFDTYLIVTDEEGQVIATDDDGGMDTNSRLQLTLPEDGTYTIYASSFSGRAEGEYELSLTALREAGEDSGDGGDGAQVDLTYGESVTGTIVESSPREPVNNKLAEPYTFSGSAGDNVEISMESGDFDTYLVLTDENGREVQSDDDGGPGLNSQIQDTLPESGIYTIWATSFSDEATGQFTLTLDRF